MTRNFVEAKVQEMIEKASKALDSGDAMRLTQAACNLAHILNTTDWTPQPPSSK
jgi:hypothetical protein